MKIINLLNKIANGEEVPRIVKYRGFYWEYNQENKDYKDNEDDWVFSCSNYNITNMLNEEVEILEEEKKITPKDFENLGYALGSIKKYINKGYDKAIEEKKIPEKIDVIGWDKCIHNVTHKEKELAIEINKTQKLLNKLLDYLKSKGE